MGTQDLQRETGGEEKRAFMQALLRDVQALERLLAEDRFERGEDRIGAEQELVIVDRNWCPAPICEEALAEIDDPHFTHELGRFNLEFNLDPLNFRGDCLSQLEADVDLYFAKARIAVHKLDAEVVMTGILPTLETAHMDLKYLTDRPRYFALNDALNQLRGRACELRIKGQDELQLNHENLMLEACNTSFQVHFQVHPDDFVRQYNAAQAVAGPILAAAVNSPLLFSRRLWHETRIALFQQSVDTRKVRDDHRDIPPRVSFGSGWVRESVLEIYREDIARFRALFTQEAEEDPLAVIDRGGAPKLSALRLHNGTVYRWNRPCYGITPDPNGGPGVPHLRIENRLLPAGPTPMDEVANAALWFGLLRGVVARHGNIAESMDFDDASSNFLDAARLGIDAQMRWPGYGRIPARELFPLVLLPIARSGLEQAGIDRGDIDRYLGVIEHRIASGRSGAQWMLDSHAGMKGQGSRPERMRSITAAISRNQSTRRPVHEWPLASMEIGVDARHMQTVEQVMSTNLFTVNEHDAIDLAASLMDWEHLRQIPVETDDHCLVGLVSHRDLIRHLISLGPGVERKAVPVSEIMIRDLVTVTPDTPTVDALELMLKSKLACLPVVRNGNLVGLVTEHDFVEQAAPLLRRHLTS